MPGQRAQRNTLTYSQMYGSGMDARGLQEGKGIFDTIGKFLKKTKIISTIGKIAGPLISILPIPGAAPAGAAVTAAGAVASQLGVGLPKKIKNLSPTQMEALKQGFGKVLKSGGISLAAAKKFWPAIKNITALQMKAVAALRARHMKGGGVSLAGGRATGMRGLGFSGMGVKLAGTGASLAGGQFVARKKRVGRPRKKMAGGQFKAQICPPTCPQHGGQLKILPFLKAAVKVKKKVIKRRKAAVKKKVLMARAG